MTTSGAYPGNSIGGSSTTVTRRRLVQGAGAFVAGGWLLSGSSTVGGESDNWSWPGLRGTGQAGSTSQPVPGELDDTVWSIGSGATQPVFDGGNVYVGVDDELRRFDASTGTGGWSVEVSDAILGAPTLGADEVFVTTEDGSIGAIDRDDSEVLWRFGLSGDPGLPAYYDGQVFVGTDTGDLYAFEASSGELVWSIEKDTRNIRDFEYRPFPTVYDGTLYVNMTFSGGSDSVLHALDPETGDTEWTFDVPTNTLRAPAVTDEYVCVSSFETIRVLAASSGTLQWEESLPGYLKAPAAVGEGVVVAVADRSFGDPHAHGFSVESGEELWTFKHEGTNPGGAVIASDRVFFTIATGARTSDVVGVTREDGLEVFERSLDGSTRTLPEPVPSPYGLVVPEGSTMTLLGPAPDGEPTPTETGAEEDTPSPTPSPTATPTQSPSADDGAGDGTQQRGFFRNDGGDLDLIDMVTLSFVGFLLSIVALLYQLKEGE